MSNEMYNKLFDWCEMVDKHVNDAEREHGFIVANVMADKCMVMMLQAELEDMEVVQ